MKGEIRYLLRKEIDEVKWNRCVRSSANGLCYGDSSFLDAMATHWSALVLNDYEAVMPLTWRKKYGVHYLYQPAFCQQTGVFAPAPAEAPADDFLSCIPPVFRYGDLQLNASNFPRAYSSVLRKNFLLPLAIGADELQNNYHRSAFRNIRKALDQHIEVVDDLPAPELMKLHVGRFGKCMGISREEYAAFERLIDQWSNRSMAKIIGARDRSGRIIASSGYLLYGNRITFIINGNHADGLGSGASHLLKDYMIRRYSGSSYTLDFEGSDNPEFARFYQQFGQLDCEYYPAVRVNRLRWPLRLLKR